MLSTPWLAANDKNVLERQKTDILIDIAARYEFDKNRLAQLATFGCPC
ncbi:hypothetical protein [Piscirickettsia salmonis]|nr:hypothetical protein [Piscirickettsia salmonis]